jgi:hypothetical protein
MYIGNNAAIRGCQEYFNRCASAGSPIGATQTPTAYDNAASFNGTNQFLSIPSNSTLTVTGSSFTYAFWANAVNTTPNQILISKRDAAGNAREYQISINGGGLTFSVFPDGSFASTVSAVVTPISANSWNFYVCRYDAVAATIGISVNGGAFSSTGSVPAITQTNTNPVQFGANPGSALFYNGALASIGFWKRALTASEVTALWNNGAGRTYASLDSGLRTNLISWWALNGNSSAVSLTDSHGGNNLTNSTNAVTAPATGPVANTYADPRQLIVDFAQGIDQLGLWNSMVCWPLRSSQNAGGGTTAFSLGGLGAFDGTLVNAPVWAANGIQSGGAALSARVNVPLSIRTSINNGASIFGVISNASDDNFAIFQCADNTDGNPTYPSLSANQANNSGVVPFVTRGGARYFQVTKGGAFSSGFSSVAGVFRPTSQANYRNGTLISDETGLAAMNPDSQVAVDYAVICARGNGPITGGGVISPFTLVSSQIYTDIQLTQLNSLYRQTLGLGLGLP